MLNNFKLDEYKLDAVCKVFLKGEGMAKEDLHFTEISPKWHSGPFYFYFYHDVGGHTK